MVKSKVTQREKTSVAKSSRKGLQKATCRRKGYGTSEACATAVTLGSFSIRFFVGNGKPQTAKCHVTKALRSRLQFAVHV